MREVAAKLQRRQAQLDAEKLARASAEAALAVAKRNCDDLRQQLKDCNALQLQNAAMRKRQVCTTVYTHIHTCCDTLVQQQHALLRKCVQKQY
jgi:hypothetical protein